MLRFPRMLFLHGSDESCCVVSSEAELAAKVAEGYQARPLPGEPGHGEVPAPLTPADDAPPARKKPGPKPKE